MSTKPNQSSNAGTKQPDTKKVQIGEKKRYSQSGNKPTQQDYNDKKLNNSNGSTGNRSQQRNYNPRYNPRYKFNRGGKRRPYDKNYVNYNRDDRNKNRVNNKKSGSNYYNNNNDNEKVRKKSYSSSSTVNRSKYQDKKAVDNKVNQQQQQQQQKGNVVPKVEKEKNLKENGKINEKDVDKIQVDKTSLDKKIQEEKVVNENKKQEVIVNLPSSLEVEVARSPVFEYVKNVKQDRSYRNMNQQHYHDEHSRMPPQMEQVAYYPYWGYPNQPYQAYPYDYYGQDYHKRDHSEDEGANTMQMPMGPVMVMYPPFARYPEY